MDSERGYSYFREKNQWDFDIDLFMALTNKAITRYAIKPGADSETDSEDTDDGDGNKVGFAFDLRAFKNCVRDHERRDHKWT